LGFLIILGRHIKRIYTHRRSQRVDIHCQNGKLIMGVLHLSTRSKTYNKDMYTGEVVYVTQN